MADINGAIADIVTQLDTVSGLQNVLSFPTEDITGTPVAVIYPTDCESTRYSSLQTDMWTVVVLVLTSLNDYRNVNKEMWPLHDDITKALFQLNEARTSSNISTIGTITATLGPIEYGSSALNFGWVFTINDLKIQNGY